MTYDPQAFLKMKRESFPCGHKQRFDGNEGRVVCYEKPTASTYHNFYSCPGYNQDAYDKAVSELLETCRRLKWPNRQMLLALSLFQPKEGEAR